MVKSHGCTHPVKDFRKDGEEIHHQNNGGSTSNHDQLELRSSEGGMDCVDSGIVRFNARQMSVDDALKEDSTGTTTWYSGTADDTCKQTSFPDRTRLNHLVLSQIVTVEDDVTANEKECEQEILLTNDDTGYFKTEKEKETNRNKSQIEDEILPTSVSVLKSESFPDRSVLCKDSVDESTKTDDFDVVDAPITIKVYDSSEEKLQNKPSDWLPTFTIMDLIFALLGVCFFVADIYTDWRLAFKYYFSNHMDMFYWTLGIILVPAILSGIISMIWSYNDHQYSEDKLDLVMLVLKVVFSILQLGRCFR